MNVNPPAGGGKYSLQLQIKQRRTQTSTEVIYQILWPKERRNGQERPCFSGNPANKRHRVPISHHLERCVQLDRHR